jgi:hypothetical protein
MNGFTDFDQKTLACPLSTLEKRVPRAFKDMPIAAVT